ncbi:hypothetical protein DQ04_18461000, partial [Trypanosoma grayi]|uniref:hypothetical protein n=1 Tax=Trypanosoma grayi TaxID=71804 RepID=UPI0004F42BD0
MTMRCVLLVCALCAWCACGCAASTDGAGGHDLLQPQESSSQSKVDSSDDVRNECSQTEGDAAEGCGGSGLTDGRLVDDGCNKDEGPLREECKTVSPPPSCEPKEAERCQKPADPATGVVCKETGGKCGNSAKAGQLETELNEQQISTAQVVCSDNEVVSGDPPKCVSKEKVVHQENLGTRTDGLNGGVGESHRGGSGSKEPVTSQRPTSERSDAPNTPASNLGEKDVGNRKVISETGRKADIVQKEKDLKQDENVKDGALKDNAQTAVSEGAPAENESSPADASTAPESGNTPPGTMASGANTGGETPNLGSSGSSSMKAGSDEATDNKPATAASPVENVKDTKNVDSSLSPVWVHAPLLLL